jgi:hypothetical protein
MEGAPWGTVYKAEYFLLFLKIFVFTSHKLPDVI